jgi:hypothetical protein
MQNTRSFFNIEGAKISKAMRTSVGALTLIEAHDTTSIIAAHCGWDLTPEEAEYFRILVASVKTLQKSTLSDEEFTASYFDFSVSIKSTLKKKDWGKGKNKIQVFNFKEEQVEKFLVVSRTVFTDESKYKFEDFNWLKNIKELLNNNFSDPNLTASAKKPNGTTAAGGSANVITISSSSEEIENEEDKLLSKMMDSPKFKKMIASMSNNPPHIQDSRFISTSINAPMRYIATKEPRLMSTNRVDFNKFREEVADQATYRGCLTFWIPTNLVSALSLIWDQKCDASINEADIIELLRGDADVALNLINAKLHIRDKTAGINMLAIKVNKDGKSPKVEEWFEAVTAALRLVGDKDDDQSKIETILGAVTETFPSVKNSFTNQHGMRAWKKLPINTFLVECRQHLADIALAVENEMINQKGIKSTFNGYGRYSLDKRGGAAGNIKKVEFTHTSDDQEEEEVGNENKDKTPKTAAVKNPEGTSMSINPKSKWCFSCRNSNPDHIWQECPKLDPAALHYPDRIKLYNEYLEEKKQKEVVNKNKKRKEPDVDESKEVTKEKQKKSKKEGKE